MAEKKWSIWTGRIDTPDEAEKVIRDVANAFFVLAAMMAVLVGLLGQYWNLVDAVVMAALAAFLRFTRSRLAAALLACLALLQAGVTVANQLGFANSGGKNIFLAVAIAWGAVRAVQATFKLHAFRRASGPPTTQRLVR